MPTRATTLTGAAGEHYVAYKLSLLGFPTALTRGGSPVIDLMVGDLTGENAVSIQVKASSNARREYKQAKNSHKNHWEWDVGAKGKKLRGDSIFYAFVNFKGKKSIERNLMPEVFIIPSSIVADYLDRPMSRYMFWLRDDQKEKYYEAWNLITDKLS